MNGEVHLTRQAIEDLDDISRKAAGKPLPEWK